MNAEESGANQVAKNIVNHLLDIAVHMDQYEHENILTGRQFPKKAPAPAARFPCRFSRFYRRGIFRGGVYGFTPLHSIN
jgi:hypothetical protein